MKHRRQLRFHGLKRPRVRQTWNIYNLYNLARTAKGIKIPISRTFFQQKWEAKALTRGYHGEHIKERAWQRMFSRRLPSVVNMDPTYMAKYDGSEQASGRGSGRKEAPGVKIDGVLMKQRGDYGRHSNSEWRTKTPYMQMTFTPMERRLDIAIFRALFASSARQARQFCVHGAVKVNGKKMKYPGYLLNPGDMFQVDIERVLYATGAPKLPPQSPTKKLKEADPETSEEASAEGSATEATEAASDSSEATAIIKTERLNLQKHLNHLKDVLGDQPVDGKLHYGSQAELSLRKIRRKIGAALAAIARHDPSINPDFSSSAALNDLVDYLEEKINALELPPPEADNIASGQEPREKDGGAPLSYRERQKLDLILAEEKLNPWDPSKPYKTPWRPRPFLAPFAFIPRYLEVNQNICAAVYLRHPVARVGNSEVPSPFGPEVNQLTYNWYLRRR